MGRRSRRRGNLPQEPVTVRVDGLAHDGRGIARVEGKVMFIDGALPGETVSARYTARRAQHDEARAEAVVVASPRRVEPRCAHFGVCGGCALQHLDPGAQVELKQAQLLETLQRVGAVAPAAVLPPLSARSWGYRRKARLAVRHVSKKGRVLVGFRERSAPYVADLHRCEVLYSRVGGLLPALGALIQGLSIHRQLPQIEVAVGDAAVALSFRVLSPPTETDCAALVAFGQTHDIQIYLQPGAPATTHLLWPERAGLSYALPEFGLELGFLPFHFTQVNAGINRPMVARAVELLAPEAAERVLDLYCGLGNFTLPLARRCREVVGVEGDAELVAWAQGNARRNAIANACFHTADLSAGDAGALWRRGPYQRVMLDPPRSGAAEMIPLVAALTPRRVVYVSCHPATLARDLGELVHRHGFALLAAGVMDMFPHTAHVESMAVLEGPGPA